MLRSMVSSRDEWFWSSLVKWVVPGALALVLIITAVWVVVQSMPVVSTMTTRHTIPYLPAQYELVEGVTNVMVRSVRWGGAGGVGAPQIEMSLEQYRKYERPGVVQYLVGSNAQTDTVLDYYDFQEGKLLHAKVLFDSPPHVIWGRFTTGYFGGVSARIEERELVVERSFFMGVWLYLLLPSIFIIVFVIWFVVAMMMHSEEYPFVSLIRRLMGKSN